MKGKKPAYLCVVNNPCDQEDNLRFLSIFSMECVAMCLCFCSFLPEIDLLLHNISLNFLTVKNHKYFTQMKLYSHPFKQCSVTIAYNITTKNKCNYVKIKLHMNQMLMSA